MKTIYAVIDTNVLVSALLTRHLDAATARVMDAILKKKITPLYNDEIIDEYHDVLGRAKFNFSPSRVKEYIDAVRELGLPASRVPVDEHMPDPKDVVFYEVALSKDDAYLVTGNIRHFPLKPIVVTPAEIIAIIEQTTI